MNLLALFLRPSDWTRLWKTGNWKIHLSLFLTPIIGLIPMWVIFFIRAGNGDYNPAPMNDLLLPFLLMSLLFWLTSIPITLIHPMLATMSLTGLGSVLIIFTTFPFGDLSGEIIAISQGLFIGALTLVGLGIIGMIYAWVVMQSFNLPYRMFSTLLTSLLYYAPFIIIIVIDYIEAQRLNIYLLGLTSWMGLLAFYFSQDKLSAIKKALADENIRQNVQLVNQYTEENRKTENRYYHQMIITLIAVVIGYVTGIYYLNISGVDIIFAFLLGILIGIAFLLYGMIAFVSLPIFASTNYSNFNPKKQVLEINPYDKWWEWATYFAYLSIMLILLPFVANFETSITWSIAGNMIAFGVVVFGLSTIWGVFLWRTSNVFEKKPFPQLIIRITTPLSSLAVIFMALLLVRNIIALFGGIPPLNFLGLTNQPYLWLVQSPTNTILFVVITSLFLSITRHHWVTTSIGGIILWLFMPYNIGVSFFSSQVLGIWVLVIIASAIAYFGVWLWLPLYFAVDKSFRTPKIPNKRNSRLILAVNNLPSILLKRRFYGGYPYNWAYHIAKFAEPTWFDNPFVRRDVHEKYRSTLWTSVTDGVGKARTLAELHKVLYQDEALFNQHLTATNKEQLVHYRGLLSELQARIEGARSIPTIIYRLLRAVESADFSSFKTNKALSDADKDNIAHIIAGEFEQDIRAYYNMYQKWGIRQWDNLQGAFNKADAPIDPQAKLEHVMDNITQFRNGLMRFKDNMESQSGFFTQLEQDGVSDLLSIMNTWDVITRKESYEEMQTDINQLSDAIIRWRGNQVASRKMFDSQPIEAKRNVAGKTTIPAKDILSQHTLLYQPMADFMIEQLTNLYNAINELRTENEKPLISLVESIQDLPSLINAGDALANLSQRRIDRLQEMIIRAVTVASRNVTRAQGITSEIVRIQSLRASEEQIYQLRRKIRSDYPNPRGDRWDDLLDPIQQLLYRSSSETTDRVGFNVPYVAGNSLDLEQQYLFKGREDVKNAILNKLGSGGKPTILIHGPRRIGKSSFLKQLSHLLPPQYVPVFFDVTGGGATKSDGDFFYQMAYQIQFQLNYQRDLGILTFDGEVKLPDENLFKHPENVDSTSPLNPASTLQHWLQQAVFPILGEGRYLYITIDEFEKIGEGIALGRISIDILNDLRFMWQNMKQLLLLFAGVQDIGVLLPKEADVADEVLKKRLRTFANPFVNTTAIALGFLDKLSAEKLVREPQPNMKHLPQYTDDAVAEILRVTNCQPFLIQALCEKVVTLVNSEIEDGEQISQIGVQWIAPAEQEVFKENRPYFDDLWKDIGQQGQNLFLNIVKKGADVEYDADLIERLCNDWKFIYVADGNYHFTIPLLEKWVKRKVPA
jgi:hypothetical protein